MMLRNAAAILALTFSAAGAAPDQLAQPTMLEKGGASGEELERALRGSEKDMCAKGKPTFSDVFVFGDSSSDVGNLDLFGKAQGDIFPQFFPRHAVNPVPPFGRFPAEYIAEAFGLNASTPSGHLVGLAQGGNYAVVGARSTPVESPPANPTDNKSLRLPVHVGAFLRSVQGSAPNDALYIMFMGGNDVLDAFFQIVLSGNTIEGVRPLLDLAAESIADQLRLLIKAGAENILVADAFDEGIFPITRLNQPEENSKIASSLTTVFNRNLQKEVERIECDLGLDIMLLQGGSALIKNAKKEGLQLDDPCIIGPFGVPAGSPPIEPYNGTGLDISGPAFFPPDEPFIYSNCELPNAEGFFFYDEVHATDATNKIAGEIGVQFICEQYNKKSKGGKGSKLCKSGRGSKVPKGSKR